MRYPLLILLIILPACGTSRESLMVTPLIYHEDGIDPLAHVDASHRTPFAQVFYATNRARSQDRFDGPQAYGNTPTQTLQIGMARVQFGDDITWEALHAASRREAREARILLRLTDVWEHGGIRFEDLEHDPTPTDGSSAFFAAVNARLAIAQDPEIVVYVHGAKSSFYDACVLTAELNHFAGRDLVPIAFSWPTHQDIFRYLIGEDIERARSSVRTFESLLRVLAQKTTARRIHIVCWSAGGRVVSRALEDLTHWEIRLREDPEAIRIGTVVFAAPDVPVNEFVKRLPELDRISERIIITASDDDDALESAALFMTGDTRMGSIEEQLSEEERTALERTRRVELVDVSHGKEDRGFDIAGHRYWFRHAWVASDVVLAIRTRLPAPKRGLEPSPIANVWYFPATYPQRVREAARRVLGGTW